MHSHRTTSKPAIAIVGGDSLLGKEVRDLLDENAIAASVRLIASEDGDDTSIIASSGSEPLVMASLQAADLAAARAVILAGSQESSRKAYRQIQSTDPRPAVIDLSGALEEMPAARLRAPLAVSSSETGSAALQVVAHPAAIALAIFLAHVRKLGAIRRWVVEIFEPASERGQAGLDELQKQTVSLLSLKPLPKDVFDAQIGFNLLSRYGEDSPHSLADVELRIDRHLASLLASAGASPMPSLRLIQAPVFHGYSMAIWMEFEVNPGVDALAAALTSNRIDVRGRDVEPPTNVGVAGQGGITVGAIATDRNDSHACWFWLVADNLRLEAENAVEVVREFLS